MYDTLLAFVSWSGLPAILFVITLVVFVHELGHFVVARAFGVKVDVFSIGFGGEIVGFNDRHGTRWKLSWLPIGGYVKFAGDANAASAPDAGSVARMSAAERAVTLAGKPLAQRALVAAAGPFANFLMAIVLLTGLFLYVGHTSYPPVVGSVEKSSPAAAAGILPDDRIVAIDGAPVDDFEQLPQIISMRGGENLAIALVRKQKTLTVYAVPHLVRQKDQFGDMASTFVIGVKPKIGLKPEVEQYSLPGALGAACTRTWEIITTSLTGIVKMVQGHASPDQIRGTIGMGELVHKVAQIGFVPLLMLVAILSVSIGLINLFPIPVLDGGHLLYYGCEAVLGRPLSERAQEFGFRFGVILVVALVLASNLHDITRSLF